MPVALSDHKVELRWDVPSGEAVALTHIYLDELDANYNHPDVSISASVDMGELPLSVDFDVASDIEITDYSWEFGDGLKSDEPRPTHVFEEMGRMDVALNFVDADGVPGFATVPVTVKPSKIDLPGLADMRRLGLWSVGFESDNDLFIQRRYEELESMNIGYTAPYGVTGRNYGEDPRSAANIHNRLDVMAGYGLVTGAEVVSRHSWYSNDEDGQPFSAWVFDPQEAIGVLAATDWDGDGTSDLESAVEWLYLGHEMGEYANRADRSAMIEITRQWFPDTPIYPYYGSVRHMYQRTGQDHPAGGIQDDYQIGAGDSNIVGVNVPGPFKELADGSRVYDPAATQFLLALENDYASFNNEDAELWVNTNLPGETEGTTAEDMWSAEEILDFARVHLATRGVFSLSFRAYGRFEFDLAYGTNTGDPTQEEYGFIEQREAVKWIGSWIKQTQEGLPILIIQQPEMQQTRPGPGIDVEYAVIGEATETVADIVVRLDDREPIHDPELDGIVPIEDVELGTHTVYAHLEDASGDIIPGTEVRVLSVHVVEGDPDEGTAGQDGGSDGGGSEGDDADGGGDAADTAAASAGANDGGGGAGHGSGGGCGCSQERNPVGAWWLGVFGLVLVGRRRYRAGVRV